jgi:hypothetical protein
MKDVADAASAALTAAGADSKANTSTRIAALAQPVFHSLRADNHPST